MCLPISRFKISDRSMLPNFKEGDFVLVSRIYFPLKIGDVVVFRHENKYLIKRISKIEGKKYFIAGDNKQESAKLPAISKKEIVGKVWKLIKRP